jgi:hypothetical protein
MPSAGRVIRRRRASRKGSAPPGGSVSPPDAPPLSSGGRPIPIRRRNDESFEGIAEARISSAGFGPGKPIASNDTEDGRAQNRRVEVVVTKR